MSLARHGAALILRQKYKELLPIVGADSHTSRQGKPLTYPLKKYEEEIQKSLGPGILRASMHSFILLHQIGNKDVLSTIAIYIHHIYDHVMQQIRVLDLFCYLIKFLISLPFNDGINAA